MLHRWSKIEWIHRSVLLILPLLFLAFTIYLNGSYGSLVDWVSQHIAFPDYFRKIFYETGSLFPEFSLNLGAGQNFAQYTYYGLIRLDVLISFLFPHLEMSTVLAGAGIFYVLLSVQLFYSWMKEKIHQSWILLFISCIFLLSSPLLFHSHRHIMFISYFPFLLLCLIGTDHYLEKKKTFLLVAGVFLMILSSYFYSVSGLVVVAVYALYAWLKKYPQETCSEFLRFSIRYLFWLLLGICLAAFYLLPTAFAMLLQTRPALQHPEFGALLFPKYAFSSMLYDSYSIGLTTIAIVSLLYWLVKKDKARRILSILIFLIVCIPLFQYVLNGFQYVRAKSLIPFLPLICMMIAEMLQDWQENNIKYPFWIFIVSLLQIFVLKKQYILILFIVDTSFLFLLLFMIREKQRKQILFVYLLVPVLVCIGINKKENYVTQEVMSIYKNEVKTQLIQQTLDENPGMYRFDDSSTFYSVNRVEDLRQLKTTQYSSNSNLDYTNFYYNTMKQPMLNNNHVIIPSVPNPFFNGFMGIRFLYDQGKNKANQYGYTTIVQKEDGFVQENKNVLPMAYISYDMVSVDQFQKIMYPYSLEAIYKNTIVEDSIPYKQISSSIKEIIPMLEVKSISNGLHIKTVNGGMKVYSKGKGTLKLRMKKPLSKDELLIIQCNIKDIKDKEKWDTDVAINGIHNKIASTSAIYGSDKSDFEYVIGNNKGINKLDFTFSRGTYILENFKFYSVDASLFKERKDKITPVNFTMLEKKKGILSGSVDVLRDGYFVTSIPYQKGLHIYIDGKKVKEEKVNTAFLGTKIKQGKHTIDISYILPGKKIGEIISVGALICSILIWVFKKSLKGKERNYGGEERFD